MHQLANWEPNLCQFCSLSSACSHNDSQQHHSSNKILIDDLSVVFLYDSRLHTHLYTYLSSKPHKLLKLLLCFVRRSILHPHECLCSCCYCCYCCCCFVFLFFVGFVRRAVGCCCCLLAGWLAGSGSQLTALMHSSACVCVCLCLFPLRPLSRWTRIKVDSRSMFWLVFVRRWLCNVRKTFGKTLSSNL